MRNFQKTLPKVSKTRILNCYINSNSLIFLKYFQNQKFLDCTLLVEGQLVPCHKFVLDACSDYFAGFLKNPKLDDKNIVICLPKEIKLWEIQAILSFMYNGEVCISQEGLSSLVKCAELLQVKGLCGNETSTIIPTEKESTTQTKTKQNKAKVGETSTDQIDSEMPEEAAESDCGEFNDQMIIKREINISKDSNLFNDQLQITSHSIVF